MLTKLAAEIDKLSTEESKWVSVEVTGKPELDWLLSLTLDCVPGGIVGCMSCDLAVDRLPTLGVMVFEDVFNASATSTDDVGPGLTDLPGGLAKIFNPIWA